MCKQRPKIRTFVNRLICRLRYRHIFYSTVHLYSTYGTRVNLYWYLYRYSTCSTSNGTYTSHQSCQTQNHSFRAPVFLYVLASFSLTDKLFYLSHLDESFRTQAQEPNIFCKLQSFKNFGGRKKNRLNLRLATSSCTGPASDAILFHTEASILSKFLCTPNTTINQDYQPCGFAWYTLFILFYFIFIFFIFIFFAPRHLHRRMQPHTVHLATHTQEHSRSPYTVPFSCYRTLSVRNLVHRIRSL